MKKNNFIKVFMSIFAIFASIGGFLFLFRDRFSNFTQIIQEKAESLQHFFCTHKAQKKTNAPSSDTFDEDEDEFSFEHAFDEDPTTAREYVSLNINPRKVEDTIDVHEEKE